MSTSIPVRAMTAPRLSSICHACRHRIAQTSTRTLIRPTYSPSFPYRAAQRNFTTTPVRPYKTIQEAKSRYKLGPFSWQAGLLFLLSGAGLTVYFRYEKDRIARARIAEQNKGVGKPLVGGPFSLIDTAGRTFTQDDLKGKYSLIYFGFTNCPDICPEELDKMAEVIDKVKERHGTALKPVFVSCDPARDTPAVIERYLEDFHGDIVGLTGTYQDIKDMCKAYRVYFSTPAEVKPGQDYLVDHSIYFFLMGECDEEVEGEDGIADLLADPDVDFVEAIGRNFSVDGAAKVINDHISDWKGPLDKTTPVRQVPAQAS